MSDSQSKFVLDTIMSHVHAEGTSDAQQNIGEDVIAKLVLFYEDRLNRQKEEMKDEFMRILSMPKPAQTGEVEQTSQESAATAKEDMPETSENLPGEENSNKESASTLVESAEETSNCDSLPEKQKEFEVTVEESEEIIEVDIRPSSATKPVPIVSLGSNEKADSDVSDNVDGGNEEKAEDSCGAVPVDLNSQVLMMMMNVIGNGGIPIGDMYQSNVQPLKVDDKAMNDSVSDANADSNIVETNPLTTKAEDVDDSLVKAENATKNSFDNSMQRPNTRTSYSTDYDPANPLFLKPPSPRFDSTNDTFQKDSGRPSSIQNFLQNVAENDHFSPSTSTASIRVQLYEKHQKQIADLKAYYEEELDELRAKLKEAEESTMSVSPLTNSRHTNTSSSPRKQSHSTSASSSNGMAELERECSSLRLKCEWLDQAYRNANQRVKDAEAQVDQLATKLSAYTLRMADAGNEIEELRSECCGKDEEINRMSCRQNRIIAEIEELNRMLHIKDQSLAESDAMLNRLMREYTSMNKDFEALKTKHDGCENILQDAKQELASAKRQMNKMAFEFRRMEHENDLLTKRLQLTSSFNVAERYSATPPVPNNAPKSKAAPLSARDYRESTRSVPPAGLPSSEAQSIESRYNHRPNNRVTFEPPYATNTNEESDLTDFEFERETEGSPLVHKVSVKDQGAQAALSEEESAVIRAERELISHRGDHRPIVGGAGPAVTKRISPTKSSPVKKMAHMQTISANFHQLSHRQQQQQQSTAAGSNMEQQFDKLLIEKQRVEASLNRLPSSPHNQTIRANKELLERQLDEIERQLASIRYVLKKSHVIHSSLN